MKKYAFITGATSGIGLATAKALAQSGYGLVLTARRESLLESVAADIREAYKEEVVCRVLDVRDETAVSRVVTDCLREYGAPDVLVNNAGLAKGMKPYSENDLGQVMQMLDTNIKGLLTVTRAFLPAMIQRNMGHIINLGSTAGLHAYAGGTVYCATKAAVKMFGDGIRIETIDTDIKVTTIQPGIVETPFSEVRFDGDKDRAKAVYAGIEALRPEDIADIIAFAVTRPRRVQISDIVIMANQQAAGFMVSKQKV